MRNTYKTLSEVNDLMYKIGCFNSHTADAYLHNNFLNESMEDEDWHRGDKWNIHKELKGKDHNTKIVMTNSYSILYNVSNSGAIPSMMEKGPSWEFCNKHAYGKGVYCNFQEYQAHESAWINRQSYGDTLVKYRYNGNICTECLVFEPQLWSKSGKLSEQIKRFNGLEGLFRKYGYSPYDLDKICKSGLSSNMAQVIIGITRREFPQHKGDSIYHKNSKVYYGAHCDDVMLHYGVQGMLYYGATDGPVAIIFNTDKLQMLSYYTLKKSGDLADDDIKWTNVPEGKGIHQATTDIRPIIKFFDKEYIANPLVSRPYCGELLVKVKSSGKWTFIDVDSANSIIYSGSSGDPRLFPDIEFEKAQDFTKVGGKEMAYVQMDKDEDSQFYLDKNGNLYRNIGEKPFSDVYNYYPEPNTPMNNDIENNDIDLGDMDDFSNFAKTFNEKSSPKLNEMLQNEYRQETQDGHVEVDNFDLARKIMKFNGNDDAYFIKIAERHKDHPDRYYAHGACAYKGFFEITSVDHLNAVEPVIKRLCQRGEWRAMMYINSRPMTATREFASDVLEPRFKRHNSHMQGHEIEVAYGQSKDWDSRPLCFIDVDNDDPQVHQAVLNYIKKMGLTPLDMYNTTNNGLHIILPDKEEARKLDFSFLDKNKHLGKWATAALEIDKSITLYAYVKAQGYGTQKKMQQKLGGR